MKPLYSICPLEDGQFSVRIMEWDCEIGWHRRKTDAGVADWKVPTMEEALILVKDLADRERKH